MAAWISSFEGRVLTGSAGDFCAVGGVGADSVWVVELDEVDEGRGGKVRSVSRRDRTSASDWMYGIERDWIPSAVTFWSLEVSASCRSCDYERRETKRTESCQGPRDPHGLSKSKHRPASLCRLDDQVLDSLAGGLHVCDDVFLLKVESASLVVGSIGNRGQDARDWKRRLPLPRSALTAWRIGQTDSRLGRCSMLQSFACRSLSAPVCFARSGVSLCVKPGGAKRRREAHSTSTQSSNTARVRPMRPRMTSSIQARLALRWSTRICLSR
jgi:hypothetical protein